MMFEITAHPDHWTVDSVRKFCESQEYNCKITEEYPFIIADFGQPLEKDQKLRILELDHNVSMIVLEDPVLKELEAPIEERLDTLTLSV